MTVGDECGSTSIATIPSDILSAHILTRLDGPTLASASCASSQLHSLSSHQNLWRDICHSTWPSTNHPRMQQLITSSGPRSFYSDTFPVLVPTSDPPPQNHNRASSSSPPPEIISAVDIHYKNNLIFSKVVETETLSGWFRWSPFRVDLLNPKDVIQTQIQSYTCQDLEEELTLSWIIIDPMGRRAANFSTRKAVSVQQHWLTGEIQLSFATILEGDRGTTEFVKCKIVVTCGKSERGEAHVREVSIQVEDMDGMNLNGKDSLGILLRAMQTGERKKGRGSEEGRKVYEEYLERKGERKESMLRREGRLDSMCKGFGLSVVIAFWMFVSWKSFIGS